MKALILASVREEGFKMRKNPRSNIKQSELCVPKVRIV
jgi:hypothetical protein